MDVELENAIQGCKHYQVRRLILSGLIDPALIPGDVKNKALQFAVQEGDIEYFDTLVSYGADLRYNDSTKSNMVEVCISSISFVANNLQGDITISYQILRRLTADHELIEELFPNKTLHRDVYRFGDETILDILVSSGFVLAPLLRPDDEPHLHDAVQNPRPGVLRYLVHRLNQAVDGPNSLYQTALHIAARDTKIEHMKMLISLGSDPNILDGLERSSLWYTVQNNTHVINSSYKYLLNLTSFTNIAIVFTDIVQNLNLPYVLYTIKFVVTKFIIREDFTCIRKALKANFRYGITSLNDCQTELAAAASTYINSRVTYADLLYLKRFDSRCKIHVNVEDVVCPKLLEHYPIYGAQMLEKFKKTSKQIDFAEISTDKLCLIPEFRFTYPENAFFKIFSFLSFQDLENLSNI
ncbi:hypothetical protein QAD02_005725 [Eretmocerus hayati]|uniref:Uncharacterized protein n=1 Tax=Eretmocerus hayati TaxID=131215 RepID=A0ACC2NUD6_9HYME|nr:hypothetical protein QAD02_005725 [Eretmocerus hayati]